MRRIVLADDLTGTLEVGAILKQAGRRVRIGLGGVPVSGEDESVVIDCQTRRMDSEAALARYRQILEAAGGEAGEVYLKVDSTLRGNVAAALEALEFYFPGRCVVFCPAYPAQGRTVESGQVLVDGEALRARSNADDAAERVLGGLIRNILGRSVHQVEGADGLRQVLDRGADGVISCDARTEDDLRAIWQAVEDSRAAVVVVGSAGLLAAKYFLRERVVVGGLAGRRWVVACGSMNPSTQRQIADWPRTVFRPPARASEAAEHLAANGLVILATPEARSDGDVTAWLVSMVQEVNADGFIVFGGDTAAAILAAYGVVGLEATGEILPGVPCSWMELEGGARIPLITKAGGFGGPGLLRQLISEITKL